MGTIVLVSVVMWIFVNLIVRWANRNYIFTESTAKKHDNGDGPCVQTSRKNGDGPCEQTSCKNGDGPCEQRPCAQESSWRGKKYYDTLEKQCRIDGCMVDVLNALVTGIPAVYLYLNPALEVVEDPFHGSDERLESVCGV